MFCATGASRGSSDDFSWCTTRCADTSDNVISRKCDRMLVRVMKIYWPTKVLYAQDVARNDWVFVRTYSQILVLIHSESLLRAIVTFAFLQPTENQVYTQGHSSRSAAEDEGQLANVGERAARIWSNTFSETRVVDPYYHLSDPE
jgi:hypothetical protein